MVGFEMFEFEVSEFTDADAGLEENFHDGSGAFVAATSIAESPILGFGENTRRFVFVFRVFDLIGRIVLNMTLGLEIAEKTLDGVNFTRNGFGGIVFFGKVIFELVEVLRLDEMKVFDLVFTKAIFN